jgi:hypothetical protein
MKDENGRKVHKLKYSYHLKIRSNKLAFQKNDHQSNNVSIDHK